MTFYLYLEYSQVCMPFQPIHTNFLLSTWRLGTEKCTNTTKSIGIMLLADCEICHFLMTDIGNYSTTIHILYRHIIIVYHIHIIITIITGDIWWELQLNLVCCLPEAEWWREIHLMLKMQGVIQGISWLAKHIV